MKRIIYIVAFLSFCHSAFAQTIISDSIRKRAIIAQATTSIQPYDKYHGFNKGDRVVWKTYIGTIIAVYDTEQCIVKLDSSNIKAKLYYSTLSHCEFCSFKEGDNIQWWKDSGMLYTGAIVKIKNEKICFVKLYENSIIVSFNLLFTDISRCVYCKFQIGDIVTWRPPIPEYTEWFKGTVVKIPKDKSTIFIKPEYDTNSVTNAASLNTSVDFVRRSQSTKK